jgi:hypothetical protein
MISGDITSGRADVSALTMTAPSPLAEEGYTGLRLELVWVRGSCHQQMSHDWREPLTRVSSELTFV